MSTPGLLGNSLPGEWRPFLADSPWNTPISPDVQARSDSSAIIAFMRTKSEKLFFSRRYTIPLWVVDYTRMPQVFVHSPRIFDYWDPDKNGIANVGVPWVPEMWPEQTNDGHISIVDPVIGMAWEMSRFVPGNPPSCTTFNLWNQRLMGYGHPHEGERWTARGGRGSGFPLTPGLIRPERLTWAASRGDLGHALVFTFPECRKHEDGSKMFIYPPACRADGENAGAQYPVQGDCFQLDPSLDEQDFDSWGLLWHGRVLARTLQRYGMFLGDRGGEWKLQLQLLAKSEDAHVAAWEAKMGAGFYREVEKIPTKHFRIVQRRGTLVVKKG